MTASRALPLFASLAAILAGQTPSRSIQRLTTTIQGCYLGESGTGFIVGEHKDRAKTDLYIITAAHVAGPAHAVVRLKLFKDAQVLSCSVVASGYQDEQHSPSPDVALVVCTKPAEVKYRFSFDVTETVHELRTRVPLVVVGNIAPPQMSRSDSCASPTADGVAFPSYFPFDQIEGNKHDTIRFFNPLQIQITGASGGPLLTERSQFVGMVYDYRGGDPSVVRALTWGAIHDWLNGQPESRWIKLKRGAHSAATLRRNNVEISASATSLYVPRFGWLNAAPQFRIGTSLTQIPGVSLAFDYTSSEAEVSRATLGIEKLTLSIPAITADLHLGSMWHPLRRFEFLGGLYAGGGIASLNVQHSLTSTQEQSNLRAWTGLVNVGWRYRIPGRSWGLTAAYREGFLYGSQAQQLYPRFRALNAGVFVVLR